MYNYNLVEQVLLSSNDSHDYDIAYFERSQKYESLAREPKLWVLAHAYCLAYSCAPLNVSIILQTSISPHWCRGQRI